MVSRVEAGNWETRAAISGAVREWFISRAVMCRLCWGIVQRAFLSVSDDHWLPGFLFGLRDSKL
jgi:hypothetical protein